MKSAMMENMEKFFEPHNEGRPEAREGLVTFSFLTSTGEAKTLTLPVLSSEEIVQMVRDRKKRFEEHIAARESEGSREERKYIAAQPFLVRRKAWRSMSGEERGEFSMMMDPNSHFGVSDETWLEQHAKPHTEVIGDDGEPI